MSSVSRWYLRKRLLDCFHIAYTHPSWECRSAFWVSDLWPIFYLWFWGHCGLYYWGQMISSLSGRYLGKSLLDCFHIAYTHPSGGCSPCRYAFLGAMTFDLIFNLWFWDQVRPIIINVLVSSLRLIWIHVLWIYGHYTLLVLSVSKPALDVRIWRT